MKFRKAKKLLAMLLVVVMLAAFVPNFALVSASSTLPPHATDENMAAILTHVFGSAPITIYIPIPIVPYTDYDARKAAADAVVKAMLRKAYEHLDETTPEFEATMTGTDPVFELMVHSNTGNVAIHVGVVEDSLFGPVLTALQTLSNFDFTVPFGAYTEASLANALAAEMREVIETPTTGAVFNFVEAGGTVGVEFDTDKFVLTLRLPDAPGGGRYAKRDVRNITLDAAPAIILDTTEGNANARREEILRLGGNALVTRGGTNRPDEVRLTEFKARDDYLAIGATDLVQTLLPQVRAMNNMMQIPFPEFGTSGAAGIATFTRVSEDASSATGYTLSVNTGSAPGPRPHTRDVRVFVPAGVIISAASDFLAGREGYAGGIELEFKGYQSVTEIQAAIPGAATAKLRPISGFSGVAVGDRAENVPFTGSPVAGNARVNLTLQLSGTGNVPADNVAVTLDVPDVGTNAGRLTAVGAVADTIGPRIELTTLSPMGPAEAATFAARETLANVHNIVSANLGAAVFNPANYNILVSTSTTNATGYVLQVRYGTTGVVVSRDVSVDATDGTILRAAETLLAFDPGGVLELDFAAYHSWDILKAAVEAAALAKLEDASASFSDVEIFSMTQLRDAGQNLTNEYRVRLNIGDLVYPAPPALGFVVQAAIGDLPVPARPTPAQTANAIVNAVVESIISTGIGIKVIETDIEEWEDLATGQAEAMRLTMNDVDDAFSTRTDFYDGVSLTVTRIPDGRFMLTANRADATSDRIEFVRVFICDSAYLDAAIGELDDDNLLDAVRVPFAAYRTRDEVATAAQGVLQRKINGADDDLSSVSVRVTHEFVVNDFDGTAVGTNRFVLRIRVGDESFNKLYANGSVTIDSPPIVNNLNARAAAVADVIVPTITLSAFAYNNAEMATAATAGARATLGVVRGMADALGFDQIAKDAFVGTTALVEPVENGFRLTVRQGAGLAERPIDVVIPDQVRVDAALEAIEDLEPIVITTPGTATAIAAAAQARLVAEVGSVYGVNIQVTAGFGGFVVRVGRGIIEQDQALAVSATIIPPTEPPVTPPGTPWAPPNSFNPFPDVPNTGWQNEGVSWAVNNGITTGYGDGTFRPNAAVTRAEFVTFLHRVHGSTPAPAGTPSFSDMPANASFQAAILWARSEGITTNTGTFRPNDPITRQEIAVMLHRDIGGTAPGIPQGTYTDQGAIASWASDGVNWVVHNGIMGHNVTALRPGDTASRAEAVTMLYRVVETFDIARP